jgi:hypothetical protein
VILAAALLVVVALGLFAGGLATGATALYWACVAASAVAAVLLVVARRELARSPVGGPVTDADDDARGDRGQAAPVTRVTPVADGDRHAPEPGREASEEGPPEQTDAPPAPARHASGAEFPVAPRTAENNPDGNPPVGESDPPVEEVEVTDLLLVVDLTDDVFVVDEHPRYHLADCRWLAGRSAVPLPMDEARADGFTPCALCSPDRNMAQAARARTSRREAP